jgi:hypothetical protein
MLLRFCTFPAAVPLPPLLVAQSEVAVLQQQQQGCGSHAPRRAAVLRVAAPS